MNDSWQDDDARQAVEAMLRAAGGYVEVSPDLRPRTLEAAYQLHRERQTRHRVTVVLLTVLFLIAPFDRLPIDSWSARPMIPPEGRHLSALTSRQWLEASKNGDLFEVILE